MNTIAIRIRAGRSLTVAVQNGYFTRWAVSCAWAIHPDLSGWVGVGQIIRQLLCCHNSVTSQEQLHAARSLTVAVSEWGLVVMGLLVLVAGTTVFRRARALATR